MNNRGRWRIGALASAIALLGSMASLQAHALALGRITVQSALGESLRAEIDISDLRAEEASSLRIGVAGAEIFKSAGLEYTAAAAGLDVKLQRRADGRSYLRLSSNRAITEPFVDLILEAKWSSGRVTRDYTMLFDPPNLRTNSAAQAAPTAPVLSRAPTPSARQAAREIAPAPYSPPAARPVAAPKEPVIRTLPAERMLSGARQVRVNRGDNASKIAAQNKPASVSLDQMLVALLRNNPDAFIGGNINVLKSGAVLDIPDAQTANALTPDEATRTLIAQSRDFNSFRRKLADSVPATQLDGANRQVDGKLQTRVDDRAQANTAADKLTLSQGAVQGRPATAAEHQLAQDAVSRAAELSKNISNPNQPGAATVTSPATAAPGLAAPEASSAAGVSAITAAPALGSASDSKPGADLSASVTDKADAALAPAKPAAAAASAAPVVLKPAVVIAPTPYATGLMDQMRDNSLLPGAGALLALLAGLAFARHRKNKKSGQVDSSFLDSRLQPDSFFGASGGRRVDTSESNLGVSSMEYSPSQLDAAGDVDPVAEADVYLAYGRDQQAEEILREALRTFPTRLAIHSKLLEILAKRRDNKGFESVAVTAFKLSKGQGVEWAYISELGRNLDPTNSIYQLGGGLLDSVPEIPVTDFTPISTIATLDLPIISPSSKNAADLDFDLGLDISLDDVVHSPTVPAALTATDPGNLTKMANPGIVIPPAMLDLDFNLDDHVPATPAAPQASANPPVSVSPSLAKALEPETDFLSNGMDFTTEPYVAPKAPIAPAAPVSHSGMLEFDLDALSLDLGPTTEAPAPVLIDLKDDPEDPLEIKFLLAEEFRVLGDSDGAKSLADEVLAKASGPLKVKVQTFLNALS
ncbi:MAG: FimV/HubP family polar landmark protein [Polaromonas sp.]